MDGAADDGDRHGVNITAIYIPLLGSSSALITSSFSVTPAIADQHNINIRTPVINNAPAGWMLNNSEYP